MLAAPDKGRVRTESGGDHLHGDEVQLDGSEVIHGEVGLKSDGTKCSVIRKMKRTDEIDKHEGSEAEAGVWRMVSMQQ